MKLRPSPSPRHRAAGPLSPPLALLLALGSLVASAAPAPAPGPATSTLAGRVTGCEHYAFVRARMPEGLAGPAREAAKSWHVSLHVAPDGCGYALDAENCQIYRIQDGIVRVLAGDGIRGYRDGPADRARFDLGVGSYQDADIKADAAGNLYVAEGLTGRLRKLARDPGGAWRVSTVAGGGTRMPAKGESIPALEMRHGCAARFAIAANGAIFFATHGGVYRIHEGKGTLVAATSDLAPRLGRNLHDWHTGGSHIAPDGWFYWMPGGGPNLLRLNALDGRAETFAGIGKLAPGLDGPTLLASGFHTVFVVYSPGAEIMFTGGGDEAILRRIAGGKAAHLQKDGSFAPSGKAAGWPLYTPLCIDAQSRLYTETGIYAWGGFVARLSFEPAPPAAAVPDEPRPKSAPNAPPPPPPPRSARENSLLQRHPAGAWGGGVYLVAFSEGTHDVDHPTADIVCARVEPGSGKPLDPGGRRICAASDLQEWPSVAWDGKQFLVVWQDFRSGTQYDIYAARVTPAGEVLDRDGFLVAGGPANECRPAVAHAAGNFFVVWMDARTYPLYSIYGARVSADGTVLDRDGGVPLDVEDPAAVAKARPPGSSWMGDRDYWWQGLSSRYLPAIASDGGERCLVAYTREYPFAQSASPKPTAVLVNAREARVEIAPVKLPGGAFDTVAVCSTGGGCWAIVLADHAQGWGLAPRLAAVRLDAKLQTNDRFAKPDSKEADRLPLENLEKSLVPKGGALLNPGKGAVAFWQPAAAWDGSHIVAATDFGWREQANSNAITHVIAVNRATREGDAFINPASSPIARGAGADRAVANPALVAGPSGEILVLYEHDEGPDRQTIDQRILAQQ